MGGTSLVKYAEHFSTITVQRNNPDILNESPYWREREGNEVGRAA
jgi:hypothetical protein